MKAFAQFVRPTWSELMDMDEAMAFAIADKLPPLDDGAGAAVSSLIASLAGRKR